MCSTVILGRGPARLLAGNYDYALGHGLIGTGLRGTRKENGRPPGARALGWEVHHGSVTFNSFSLELPTSGMNERGLCVALMWHDEGHFGADGTAARLSPLQWIQYQLDTCASVAEVIDGLAGARPRDEGVPLHYLVLDATGDCVVVEFLDGEPELTRDPDVPVLTNSTYRRSLAAARAGNPPTEVGSRTSLGRFETLARLTERLDDARVDTPTALALLDAVRQGDVHDQDFPWTEGTRVTSTVWSVVMRPETRAVEWVSHRNPDLRTLSLGQIDFSAYGGYRTLDVHDGTEGDVTELLEPYRIDANRALIAASSALVGMSDAEQEGLARTVDALYSERAMPAP